MVVPSDAKGIMEQPVTPRPCFNQPKLAVVEKARARLLHSFKEPSARTTPPQKPPQALVKVRIRLRSRYRSGAGAGLADAQNVMIHVAEGSAARQPRVVKRRI